MQVRESLPDVVATADKNVRAGSVRRGGRCKVSASTSELRNATKSAHGVLEGPLVTKTRLGVKADLGHGGLDVAGGDGIDSNLKLAKLSCHGLDEVSGGGLGGVVCTPGHVSVHDRARHGCGDNDGAGGLGGNHLSGSSLGSDEDTGNVNVHDLSEPLGGVLVARGSGSEDSGVRNDNVDGTVGLGNVLEDGVHSLLVGDVSSLVDQRSATGHSLDVRLAGQEVVRGSLGHIEAVDRGAQLSKTDRVLKTNTRVATGDNSNTVGERELSEDFRLDVKLGVLLSLESGVEADELLGGRHSSLGVEGVRCRDGECGGSSRGNHCVLYVCVCVSVFDAYQEVVMVPLYIESSVFTLILDFEG